MKRRIAVQRPSPAMAVALAALFLALGGTSYAAFSLPKNSVGTKQLRKGAVTTKKIKNGAVTDSKIAENTITGDKLNLGGLGTVPSATHANTADSATNATNATNANHATNADNATHAATANAPGTLPAGQTETGTYSLGCDTSTSGRTCAEGESFSFTLPEASVPATYLPAGSPPTAQCPGSASAPSAASGHLCVYEAGTFGPAGSSGVFDPGTSGPTFAQANSRGFGVFDNSSAAGSLVVWGAWAVTA